MLVSNEGVPFDGAGPNTLISSQRGSVPTGSIDYSSYISGNPEVNLGSPTPDPSPIEWCFPGPSSTTANDNFNYSTTLKWSAFDMPALDFDGIVDEPGIYPNDNDLFDAVITYDDY